MTKKQRASELSDKRIRSASKEEKKPKEMTERLFEETTTNLLRPKQQLQLK